MTENNKPLIALDATDERTVTGVFSPDCSAIMVYATFPNVDEATKVGRELVEKRLAGCVNILPGMTSIYAWEGNIETTAEAVLIAKTVAERAETCVGFIRDHHVYEVPAILMLPVIGGLPAYLEWLRAGTSRTGPP